MPRRGDDVACQRPLLCAQELSKPNLSDVPRSPQQQPRRRQMIVEERVLPKASRRCPHRTPTIATSLRRARRFDDICTSMHLQGQEGGLRRGYTELVEGTQWGRDVSLLASLVWMAKDSLIVYCHILTVLC
ncbi:uncharacterized protein LACBIDRAFT_318259 [Laccaria bicolor S238N-H82]|uniref:Predicted protein n=1 Tax=Laccaria bicolor (strain S238N-H82 / ATCC MYA-4686) TaxID=486041 RepID=B0D6B3_LACBS|nr:uncharacterized protein LACBIDRAFT_318259 [Laccaria bicolor S238N-H82]EDR10164.1 predicted protein [Laccaria bicolor S238N-H82]|eukprot:XP_001879549.1 predicted protein [Laccaria bicolor S238N-H82]